MAILTAVHLLAHDLSLLIFPASIVGAHATAGRWSGRRARLWFALLWAGYALAPPILFSYRHPDLLTVPYALLMAMAVGLLARQIGGAGADRGAGEAAGVRPPHQLRQV